MEDILRKLIAFPTVDGNTQAQHDLLEYVADFVTVRGMCVEWHESNGSESITASVQPGNKTPKVALMAHADVVAAPSDMFQLRKQDGRYLGRGVLDMKFAIAAYMQVIDELSGQLDTYDFSLMITSDEEAGGTNGTGMLVNKGYLPQACLLPDGGDNWHVQTGSKGILLYEISVQGKAAHGARPWLGDNALTKLINILDEIAALFPRVPQMGTNTISLTGMDGGESLNQIPSAATMRLDIRAINSAEYARLHEAVARICDKRQAEWRVASDGVPTQFELTNPFIAPFAHLVESITGTKQTGFFAMGSSDARYFVPYGTPCVMVYPAGGNAHSDDEWLDVTAFGQFKDITRRYLDEVAR